MAKKASDNYKIYKNPNGPDIGTVSRKVIEKDGLYFKDIDGSGEFKPFDDWRLSPAERAAAYVKELTVDEKIAQLFISDWRMGKYPAANGSPNMAVPKEQQLDESGILDEAEFRGKTIFGDQYLPGTSDLIKNWFARHIILRANPTPDDLADFLNQLNAVAEECEHFVPVQAASNSRNENGEIVFGMNDGTGSFAAWPGTMGIAAAVKGDSIEIIDKWADCIRREWNSTGLKKGYMYMADVMSDPRWQRTFGTFGEDPDLITAIFEKLIPGVQGSEDGVTPDGVAMTVKHFPGGGPRENGFDPHYKAGQWNVYATEGSFQKYHVKTFFPAVKYNASSIMPYYSKPAAQKSAPQKDVEGNPVRFDPYGFAYNKVLIDGMLRGQMGFKGYINSDTGIAHNMCWGVEALDVPERIGFAVNQSGVDVISGLFDNEAGREAYDRGKNGWYETHPVPEGYKAEDIVLTDESIDRAVTRTLTEMFTLGMFDNPYADPKKAVEVFANEADRTEAALVHRKSVVLLKNDGILPLTAEKTSGKKLYVECFYKDPRIADLMNPKVKEMFSGIELTDDYNQADIAVLMVNPQSGNYFSATQGYLELDICENKTVCDVDEDGKPMATTHSETTLPGAGKIDEIADAVHAKGGKVIANINFTLAWEVGNVEKYADALTAGFDTFPEATVDVYLGRFNPTGKLPITLPKGDEVLAVNSEGVCVSRNDVPGYDKDKYMPESMKDENGKAYAYRDSAGNYYEMNFGLSF